ncbi:MAG: chaperone modulator CbpM [Fluviicoccus sp.]|uniref:chaperone modulator CbpM n=1 Tax=Fluviicoccus sp. TaxID=2003552 RepID=UPI002722F411|nr:chaperone modulator CbpM [Fluviicoccus sp.]MDO8331985.1 chaperone modulator CbpM [Fluviicoccus sp.]
MMNYPSQTMLQGVIVEEEIRFTLVELCQACRADFGQLVELVDEGILTAMGDDPQGWRFEGSNLRRARTALRLTVDLELNAAGVALVLDLLEEIEVLKSRLRQSGLQ